MTKEIPEEVRKHLSEIGRKGGQSKSEKKLRALEENRKKRGTKTDKTI